MTSTLVGTASIGAKRRPGVQVVISGPCVAQKVTGIRGQYFFTGLPAGIYRIWIRAIGCSSAMRTVRVRPGETKIVNLLGNSYSNSIFDPRANFTSANGTPALARGIRSV